jgi:heme/copper-type cytochrome/quinol oxidase subunit 3
MNGQNKKIHPHKFLMWVAIGSILMMFAGLTSAYIVKRNQASWMMLDIPVIFWISTIAILASSVTDIECSMGAIGVALNGVSIFGGAVDQTCKKVETDNDASEWTSFDMW